MLRLSITFHDDGHVVTEHYDHPLQVIDVLLWLDSLSYVRSVGYSVRLGLAEVR